MSGLAERARLARPGVTRWLGGQGLRPPAEELRDLADVVGSMGEGGDWDRYGEHGPVGELERRVAGLLGKPAAAMFPSGVMAQQSMLRVWSDQQGSRRVALPELSHLLHHEQDGPRRLHGFQMEHLTEGPRVPVAADLAAIPGPLGAVLLELPLRDAGFLLPSWEELVELAGACRDRRVPLHLDGARIWESAPHLGHGLAEIAGLADSVYVSFYKGLGGLAGAALAGPEDEIAQARRWRTRHGGTLFTLLPYAVAALRGLDTQLPRMAEYHERAILLARLMQERGFRVAPDVPHTNAFRLYAPAAAETVEERRVSLMERERVGLTAGWVAADAPGWSWTEFAVGPATMGWDAHEAADLLAEVLLG